MTRPYHSLEGFRGLLLMSTAAVFVLVEGREVDQYFYGEICRSVCSAAGLSFEVYPSDCFSESGGKSALIGLYKYLEGKGSLALREADRNFFCIFFMDKDVDDILCELISSPHIVYTPFYNVENALFRWGDLIKAAAVA